MPYSLLNIIDLLNASDRWKTVRLLLLTTLMALVEIAGVASVLPFLAVLGNPEGIEESQILSELATFFSAIGIVSTAYLLAALGAMSFLMLAFSAAIRSFTQWQLNCFVEMQRHNIGATLVDRYLAQDYSFFLTRDNSALSKKILSEVDIVVQNVLRTGFNMVAYSLVVIFLIIFLFVFDPLIALLTISIISVLYGIVFWIVKGTLKGLGQDLIDANAGRFKLVNEIFTNIKFIKVSAQEHTFFDAFSGQSYKYARSQSIFQTIVQLPNHFIELAAMGSLLVLCVFLILKSNGAPDSALGEILPMIGLYAFAAYRIKPALHVIYSGIAGLRFGLRSLESLAEDLNEELSTDVQNSTQTIQTTNDDCISFIGVRYRYPSVDRDILGPLNFTIPAGALVGVVGETGSGKSTLLDLLLGVLMPDEGYISFKGSKIDKTSLRSFQTKVAYVPQEVLLSNASVKSNVAFGEVDSSIKIERVKRATQLSQIENTIKNKFPEGYETLVGERGFKVSGGERQRIGLARALYRSAELLVLDEATSALDEATEAKVINGILDEFKDRFVVMAAHREATLKKCSLILQVKDGKVRSFAGYQDYIIAKQSAAE